MVRRDVVGYLRSVGATCPLPRDCCASGRPLMTNSRLARSARHFRAGGAALVSSLSLLAACSDVPSSSETVQKQTQLLSATQAAQLAHPEYDLNTPASYWWMHSASAAIIDAKIAEGY